MSYIARLEQPSDHAAVESITRDAFWDVYQPGTDVHYFVHRLRDVDAFVPELGMYNVLLLIIIRLRGTGWR